MSIDSMMAMVIRSHAQVAARLAVGLTGDEAKSNPPLANERAASAVPLLEELLTTAREGGTVALGHRGFDIARAIAVRDPEDGRPVEFAGLASIQRANAVAALEQALAIVRAYRAKATREGRMS